MSERQFQHRETWLNEAAKLFSEWFEGRGFPLPDDLRLTCGFPSARALSATPGSASRRIGECWHAEASGDSTVEIMVSPVIDEPVRVLGVLAHELIHAACGPDVGHCGAFRRLAGAIGLEGKMTATTEGERFKRHVAPMLAALGPYPHAALNAALGRKKQSTRLIKVECPDCGYVARVTRKWLEEAGAPLCPNHGAMEIAG